METSEEAYPKLKEWSVVLEGNRLRVSHTKGKYLRSKFSGKEQDENPEVIFGEDIVFCTTKFKYLNLDLSRVMG